MEGEPKNIVRDLVQEGYKGKRGLKLPSFKYRHIVPKMQNSESSRLPIAMVPCLHQNNNHIKRKL